MTSMAENTGEGYRKGPVTNRTQNKAPNGNPIKRDTTTGRIIDQKTTPGDYKGIRHEKQFSKIGYLNGSLFCVISTTRLTGGLL